MSCPITDAGVAGLAIDEGRAELLEEILTLAPVETTESRPGHRHRRVLPVLPVLAAAAAVVAVVGGVAWLGVQRDDDVRPAPAVDPAVSGELVVMDGHGWEVTEVTDHPAGGELTYEFDRDGRTLEIAWRQAVLYGNAVAAQDRTGTSVEVEVLGRRSLMWTSGLRDHTVIRPVEGRFWVEVHGSGMDEAAFREVLGQLRLIEHDDLRTHLPDDAILDDERAAAIDEALTGIPLPPGMNRADLPNTALTRYEVVADVTAAVTCAWIDLFEAARMGNRTDLVTEAQQAMATAREWPALKEVEDQGGWSDAIWRYADIVVAGAPTAQDQEMLDNRFHGIGCPGGGTAGSATGDAAAP